MLQLSQSKEPQEDQECQRWFLPRKRHEEDKQGPRHCQLARDGARSARASQVRFWPKRAILPQKPKAWHDPFLVDFKLRSQAIEEKVVRLESKDQCTRHHDAGQRSQLSTKDSATKDLEALRETQNKSARFQDLARRSTEGLWRKRAWAMV